MSWLCFKNKNKSKNRQKVKVVQINHRKCVKLQPNEILPNQNYNSNMQNTNMNYITQSGRYLLPHAANAKHILQTILLHPNSRQTPNTIDQRFTNVLLQVQEGYNTIGPYYTPGYFNQNHEEEDTLTVNFSLYSKFHSV